MRFFSIWNISIMCLNKLVQHFLSYLSTTKKDIFPFFNVTCATIGQNVQSDCGCKCAWELWFLCYLVNMVFQFHYKILLYL